MGTKASGKPDRRHIQRKTLASVRKRVRELEAEAERWHRCQQAGPVPTVPRDA